MKVGTKLSALNGSVMWLLGDWLAYGHRAYQKEKWGGRVPNGLYERISFETGYSQSTLRNAKFLCSHLEPACRQENLTFTHAQEIVALAPKNEIKKWIDKVVTEKLSVKAMREQLRREKASFQPESNDDGTTSVLETTRQFVRDFLAQSNTLNPRLSSELKRVLLPVMERLG